MRPLFFPLSDSGTKIGPTNLNPRAPLNQVDSRSLLFTCAKVESRIAQLCTICLISALSYILKFSFTALLTLFYFILFYFLRDMSFYF